MTDPTPVPTSMNAFRCRRYGGPDVLDMVDMPVPDIGVRDVLVAVRATTVASGDRRVRAFDIPQGMRLAARLALGWSGPRQSILGTEFSGTIVAAGKDVTRFKVGDAVFAFPGGGMRAHAQYCKMPEDGRIALKPERLSFAEAASLCFGGSTAMHYARATRLKPDDKVLVIGASGSVGSSLIQLASISGAEVTGVCSGANADLVRDLGADKVVDYQRTHWRELPETYDIIFDCVGGLSFGTARKHLNNHGRFAPIAAGLPEMLAMLWAPLIGNRRVIAGPAEERPSDVSDLAALVESGKLRPVIDRIFPFAAMRDAHAYVDTGRKRGNVVIDLDARCAVNSG